MQVNQGQAPTGMQPVPTHWQQRTLFELAGGRKELFDDGDWIESEHITTTGIRLIQTGNIGIGTYVEKETKKYIYEVSFASLRCKPLEQGDLLICRLADPAGRACVLPDIGESRVVTSVDVTIFRPPPDVADRTFLCNVFSTPNWFRAVSDRSGGTTHKRISRGALGRIAIALPPIEEQRAIAAALNDVDALLVGLDRLIAKKRDLKQAAMQQLLTGHARLPGFKGRWETRSLGSLGTWHGGMTPSMANPAYWEGGDVPWISSGDVKAIRLSDTSQHVTSLAVREGAAVMVPAGAVVLVTRSGILRKYLPVAALERPMAINQDIKALIPDKSVSSDFALHAMRGHGDRILATCLKAGTTVESVEFPWLRAFAIPLPPREEQEEVAAVLSGMDAELAALEARRDKTRALKQGMMQELLTGRTRLV